MTPVLATFSAASVRGFGWLYRQPRGAVALAAGLYAWGRNDTSGPLGLNDTTNRSTPTQIGTLTTWSTIAAGSEYNSNNWHGAHAIKTDGTLWSWGYNNYGSLGLGDTTARSSPVQVGVLTNWASVQKGEFSVNAIKTDGTLWGWGSFAGSSGLSLNYSSPVQVGAVTTWSSLARGGARLSSMQAIRTNGTLWAWGFKGNDGAGNILSVCVPFASNTTGANGTDTPVQITTDTNFSKVASGYYHAIVVRTNGTLWGWGVNTSGQINSTLNNPEYYSYYALFSWYENFDSQTPCPGSPPPYERYNGAASFSAWNGSECSSGVDAVEEVITSANTIKWGFSSPVQIGALTNWSKVAAGGFSSYGIKTDGTLWAWGLNSSGQLGLGSTTNYSSPVQVGALTTWAEIYAGYTHVLAIKTDGTLWAWGTNTYGQLGQGNTTSYSSPVQIGSETTWTSTGIATGWYNSYAIKT